MSEIWLDIPEFEGDYQVSSHGRVRSIKAGRMRILSQKVNNMGYLCVSLCKQGHVRVYKVHRLVGIAFVEGKTEQRREIDHIDTNPLNNHCENLRWVTHSENLSNPKTKSKLRQYKIGKIPSNAKPVLMYDKNNVFVKEFPSAGQAAVYIGCKKPDRVNACCRGQRKTCCGYKFKWKHED